jgi:hypothetical protein
LFSEFIIVLVEQNRIAKSTNARFDCGFAPYFGDLINGYLVPQTTTVDYSLFSIVADAAINAGVKPEELPDYKKMFAQVASTVGKPEFGILQVPADHQPGRGRARRCRHSGRT